MALNRNNQIVPSAQLNPNKFTPDELKAEWAFQTWAALRRAAASEPSLLANPYYEALCWEAHDDFQTAFARLA